MQDKVGGIVPSDKEIAARVEDVQVLVKNLKKYCIVLSKDERQATTKMRAGGESIAALVGKLATEHAVSLPGISVDGMNADLQLAKRLQPLADAVSELSLLLSDTMLEAHSEAWWTATAYYTALARMTPADPNLEAALKPAVDFFATGRRKAKTTQPK